MFGGRSKNCTKKKLLYKSHKVVPYCPRCETPLSTHEVAQGYQEVTEDAITVQFKEKDGERLFLAWTTTPWTLPGNIALAVHPQQEYAVVLHKGKQFVLGREAVEKYFSEDYEIKQTLQGEELVGINYEPLFTHFKGKLDLPAWKIIPASYVTAEEGTGIVHQAPAFGEEDYTTVKQQGMAFIQPIDLQGKYTSDVPEFEGQFVKQAEKAIIARLKEQSQLFQVTAHRHTYPFCWRCKTPLLYNAIDSWFIKVTGAKEQILQYNEKINWFPHTIKHGRFGEWLRNVKDWALSRNKFWGTPLPIWHCEACDEYKVIGSIDELKEQAVSLPDKLDLHKPAIDEVRLKCSCGGTAMRVSEVIDCWYDSGAAPFAQYHYPFENKALFEKAFPYDFIAEATDQTRGWFYTLHILGTLLFDSPAYKNVVCAGLLVDEKGEKMSKTKGNMILPLDAFQRIGVDAVRMQFLTTAPGAQKPFGYEQVREKVQPLLTILWNCARFALPHLQQTAGEATLQQEDAWILSRVHHLTKTVTENLEQHEYAVCFFACKHFIEQDFSKWYIKLIRDRAQENDGAVASTLRSVFHTLLRLLAPMIPYVTEYLWQELALGEKSVHEERSWPAAGEQDASLEEAMLFC